MFSYYLSDKPRAPRSVLGDTKTWPSIEVSTSNPFTIAIEGNIGAGKTTFLEKLKQKAPADITALAEPLDKWRNVEGHNLLDLMYQDPSRWAMTFQSYAQLTALQSHTQIVPTPIKVMERSIHSVRHCFTELLLTMGSLHIADYRVLLEWYDFLMESATILPVDLTVYMRTTPELAFERVRRRSRLEETTVSLQYLQLLHDVHENWLFDSTPGIHRKEIYVIDAGKDGGASIASYNEHAIKVLRKVQHMRSIPTIPARRSF